MDNHPIPQDITGFQFKLIGNMTVRQFTYLAAGSLVAVFFLFILPIPFIIGLIIAIISFALGAAFAFVPIGGRPMDTMVGNFFRALFAPTQYIYHKTGGNLQSQKSLGSPQNTQISVPSMDSSVNSVSASPAPAQQVPSLNLDDESKLKNEENLAEEASMLEQKVVEVKSEEKAHPEDPNIHQKAVELERLLEETQKQKEALEKELISLKAQLEAKTPAVTETKSQSSVDNPVSSVIASPFPQPIPDQTSSIPQAPAGNQSASQPPSPQVARQAVGLATPESPNLITGIVKDPRGNPLQNILVEIKDEENNPVRAFKTNGLGQFASATPVTNGKYVLIFEDPKEVHKFDPVQIETTGSRIMPIEIASVDPREELRRQLFANG